MSQFVVVYKGGAKAETPEAQQASMEAWMGWFGSLGSAVSQMGAPFGASAAVASDATLSDATTGLTGYTVIEANDLAEVAKHVASCPIHREGGTVEVFEALAM